MADLAFKEGVRIPLAMLEDPRVLRMLRALVLTAPNLADDAVVITSARDGRHSGTSRHYVGLALDVRILGNRPGGLVGAEGEALEGAVWWRAQLARHLGPDYDVVLEVDHLHLEWDAK